MTDDRAMFAMGLPGGVRDAEPVETVSPPQTAAKADAPVVTPASRKPVDLDAVVLELKAAAGVAAERLQETKSEAGEDEPALAAEEADLGSVVLPRIAGIADKSDRSRRLPMAALASILIHGVAFAMALHVVEIIPEAPAEEGGVVVSVVMLGNGDVDAAASGAEEARPTEVETQTVPVEQAVTAAPEALSPAASEPPPQAMPAEQAQPVEMQAAPMPTPEAVAAAPVETAETRPAEAIGSAEAAALPRPEPAVLAVAPSEAAAPDAVAPAAAVVSEAAPLPETAYAARPEVVETATPEAETVALAVATPQMEAITAQEDDPELAYDIAPPVPRPSPWDSEPLPEDQVAARQAEAERRQAEQKRTVPRQSAGSGGQSASDARRGSVSGTSEQGATQAAESRSGSSGDGAAAMANYAGRVHARLARWVAAERYYRNLGPLTTTVTIRLTLNRSGNITALSLARSSGNSQVDAVVLQRARAAGSFGPFPESYAGAQKSFTLPVNLTLRR
ncbi:TonB family protein [Martelella lutilitoris]|uniref:TonB family protein n=1 Tax=Martelella lutilitoris TaxID=2583532 RepID=A0A5C4JTD4_9HYPH|nr:TonB family protein [Martelella lutilitoris]TNB47919.1 TonB family protein [Martelella lutilitoris]